MHAACQSGGLTHHQTIAAELGQAQWLRCWLLENRYY